MLRVAAFEHSTRQHPDEQHRQPKLIGQPACLLPLQDLILNTASRMSCGVMLLTDPGLYLGLDNASTQQTDGPSGISDLEAR